MDSPPAIMTDRAREGRELLPNLRGEDETDISYLANLIESEYATAVFLHSLVTEFDTYQHKRGPSSQPNNQRAS
jgi:hypothetical protein